MDITEFGTLPLEMALSRIRAEFNGTALLPLQMVQRVEFPPETPAKKSPAGENRAL
jgi:hypothetical protein